jgi:NTP pyrophosphatase (non-canonical NTP hydrolase)
MNIRDLQLAHKTWLLRNFPKQARGVSAQDVTAAIATPKFGVLYDFAEAAAEKINSGELSAPMPHALLGLAEEVGELSHACLKMAQGIRGATRDDVADAVGDVFVYLMSFCNTRGVDLDLEACVHRAWEEVRQRDWLTFPENGRDK